MIFHDALVNIRYISRSVLVFVNIREYFKVLILFVTSEYSISEI